MLYLFFFFILATRFFNIFCLNAQFSRLGEWLGKDNSGWGLAQPTPGTATANYKNRKLAHGRWPSNFKHYQKYSFNKDASGVD